jgi:autotransporter-associated beta strand protein
MALSKGIQMTRNDMRPLRAAVKAALRGARSVHTKPISGSVALLALSAAAWVPPVMAAPYTASSETEFRNDITSANADPDPNATITLTSNVTLATPSIPAPAKPITIDTGGFTLSGTYINTATAGALNLSGPYTTGAYTFKGTVQGGTSGAGGTTVGQIAIYMNTQASVINNGSLVGGVGGGLGGDGGDAVYMFSTGKLSNYGTIIGGNAPVRNGGRGAFIQRGSTLTNYGTLQGGDGQLNGGSGADFGPPTGGAAALVNYGTVQGGTGVTGSGGAGVYYRNGAAPIVNYGTIAGGNGAAAIHDGTAPLLSVINSGTLKAGSGYANAIDFGIATQAVTLELHSGSVIQGNVAANTGVTNTLILGGDTNASFDVSTVGPQYQNFNVFQKTGASTWTLTGAGSVATPWQIQQGTLQLGNGGTSGSIIGNVTNNGTLAFNRSDTLTYGGIISGTGSVIQVGTGTSILTGTNAYSGGTAINGGVLQVSSDANLGATAGDLSFNGGSLHTTADINSARAVSLVGAGCFITDAGTTLTLTSAVSGAGSLSKDGAGTLALEGDNSYAGGTSIHAGILQMGAGGTTGSIAGDVLDNGTLSFNRRDALTFGGAISGTGSVTQIGTGTTILTGNNSYAGGTTIGGGTLQVGDGGTVGSIGSGDVLDNGALSINHSDTLTIAGVISGTGSVSQVGTGTAILTGNNTYGGGTIIGAGSLQVGNGGTSGSLTGNVTNNGTLVFDRSDASAFAGVITGGGLLRQSGTGTTTLSGAGSNVSELDVQAGTLALTSSASIAAGTVNVGAGATLLNNGALVGAAGNDTFAVAGTFIGSASLFDGNDLVQIADGANISQATFDGGAGVDTLELTTSQALTLEPTLAKNFEILVKLGNGALTLSGTVDGFSNSITIAGGSAQLVNANIITQQMNIESGATLSGIGSLTGSLMNAGVLSPGNSPGTLHVGGDYVQTASGTLVSQIQHTGTDLLDISGTAALAGAHQIHIEYGLYLDGTTQTLIRAAGGISGQFDSVEINPSALMTASRQLTANEETVSFARLPITSITDPQSGRGRFATWLEDQISGGTLTPKMTDYIDSLLQQPTAQGAVALLGERSAPVANIAQNSVSILGASFARTVFQRFTDGDMAQCVPTQERSSDALNCFWAHGLRQWGHAGGDTRYDWTTDGGQFGVDRDLSSGWALGFTFGYADSDTHDLNQGRNDVRSKMGGLYLNYAPEGRLTAGALMFYSGNNNDTRRNVQVGGITEQARAKFDSDSYGAGVRIGYRVTGDAGPLVRPFIEALFDHIEGAELSETGAGDGDLSAHVHGRDGMRGTLGVQFADDFDVYGRVLRPALEMGVAHEFADVRSTIDLQPFSDASAFRTYGPELDRTAYIARASLNVSLGKNASVALGYGGEVSDSASQHEANLSFQMTW